MESSDSFNSVFAWTLNNPAGNLNMDTNLDPRITDWALDSTGTLTFNSGIFTHPSGQVTIGTIVSANMSESLANGEYMEVSYTTGSEISFFELTRIQSRPNFSDPSSGDSYYSSTLYSEAGSNAWRTLSTDTFHSHDGSGNRDRFQHIGPEPISLMANTEYRFRIYVYGQIDDSPQTSSVFDDLSFAFSACRTADTDGDTFPDHLDSDSDDDNCNDTNEAYADSNADSNGDGTFGGVVTSAEVNANGLVVSAGIDGSGDDYNTTPAVSTISSKFTFQEAGATPTITMEPEDQSVFLPDDAAFDLSSTNTDTYQWQLSTDSGSTFSDISDGTEYAGTKTDALTVISPDSSKNGYLFRVIVINSNYVCGQEVSNEALLTVGPRTVITNRRITFRVKRN